MSKNRRKSRFWGFPESSIHLFRCLSIEKASNNTGTPDCRMEPMGVDPTAGTRYTFSMSAIEFTTELSGTAVLNIPREIAAQLPKSGKARVIVLMDESSDDSEWRSAAYEQFLRNDAPDDAIYESLR